MASFDDPLQGASLEYALQNLIWFLLGFVGLLTILGIIYGGIHIITGLGNQSAVEQGKKIIFWSVAGMTLVALAGIIVELVANAIGL